MQPAGLSAARKRKHKAAVSDAKTAGRRDNQGDGDGTLTTSPLAYAARTFDAAPSSSASSSSSTSSPPTRKGGRNGTSSNSSGSEEALDSKATVQHLEYTIRPMELRDCATCFHLGERVFTSQFPNLYRLWDEYEVIDAFSSDNNKCFVAETTDKKLVGFIFGDEIKKRNSWRYGYVHWIAIDPLYRRRGIATELYNRVAPLMLQEGVRMILCDTPADNYVARAFFEKHGFGTPINHVYMSLNVSQQAEQLQPEDAEVQEGHHHHQHQLTASNLTTMAASSNSLSMTSTSSPPPQLLSSNPRRSSRRRGVVDDSSSTHSTDDQHTPTPSASAAKKKRKANVVVREMMIDDINDVYELGERVFGDRRSPNLFRFWEQAEVLDLFETDSEFCLIAEVDDKIVGFSLGTTIKKKRSAWKYGYLIWLGVAPEYQGQGIGVSLFQHFQGVAIADGARMLFIDTQADSPAVRFWRKQGFGHSQAHVFLSKRIGNSDADADQQHEQATAEASFMGTPSTHHHHQHVAHPPPALLGSLVSDLAASNSSANSPAASPAGSSDGHPSKRPKRVSTPTVAPVISSTKRRPSSSSRSKK